MSEPLPIESLLEHARWLDALARRLVGVTRVAAMIAILLLAGTARAEEPATVSVDPAIDRGVGWLRRAQRPDGSWGGRHSTAGLTALAHHALTWSGARRDGPALVRSARFLAALPSSRSGDLRPDLTPALRGTYEHALTVLALVSSDPTRYAATIRRSVRALVAGQKSSGLWAYGAAGAGPKAQGDHSNTQFALMALEGAEAAGFDVPRGGRPSIPGGSPASFAVSPGSGVTSRSTSTPCPPPPEAVTPPGKPGITR